MVLIYLFLLIHLHFSNSDESQHKSRDINDCQWVSYTANQPLYAIGPCITSQTDTLTQSYRYSCNHQDKSLQITFYDKTFCEGQVKNLEEYTYQGQFNTYWNCESFNQCSYALLGVYQTNDKCRPNTKKDWHISPYVTGICFGEGNTFQKLYCESNSYYLQQFIYKNASCDLSTLNHQTSFDATKCESNIYLELIDCAQYSSQVTNNDMYHIIMSISLSTSLSLLLL